MTTTAIDRWLGHLEELWLEALELPSDELAAHPAGRQAFDRVAWVAGLLIERCRPGLVDRTVELYRVAGDGDVDLAVLDRALRSAIGLGGGAPCRGHR